MYSVESKDKFYLKGKGTVLVIPSPVESNRDFKSYSKAIGGSIEIDKVVYKPISFEWYALATPISVGEMIGVLVQTQKQSCKQKWLIFPNHDFDRWEDVGEGVERLLGMGGRPVLIQERECRSCGLKQRRKVYVD